MISFSNKNKRLRSGLPKNRHRKGGEEAPRKRQHNLFPVRKGGNLWRECILRIRKSQWAARPSIILGLTRTTNSRTEISTIRLFRRHSSLRKLSICFSTTWADSSIILAERQTTTTRTRFRQRSHRSSMP